MTLGGVGGGNRNSWKMWKLGYFYLTNRWSDLNEIWYSERIHVLELLFQIPTRSVDIRWSWRGKPEICENAYKYRRDVIDLTGLDPLSLGELGMGFRALVLLNVLGRWKLVRVPGSCTYLLDKVVIPDTTIWGAEGRGKIRKIELF